VENKNLAALAGQRRQIFEIWQKSQSGRAVHKSGLAKLI